MLTSFNARALGLDVSAERAIELAATYGFQAVDLLVRDLLDRGEDPHSLGSMLDDAGLRGGAWPLPVTWRGERAVFDHDLAELPRYAKAASLLGLKCTGTWVLPALPVLSTSATTRTAAWSEVLDFHLERLGSIARILADFGSRLGLEVIGVKSARTADAPLFIARYGDLGVLLDALRDVSPDVGILLDLFHIYAAGENVEAGLRGGIERIVWVHVADLSPTAPSERALLQDHERSLPGKRGVVDVAGGLARLSALGYDGPVTAEPLARCDSLRGLSDALVAQKVREALGDVWPHAAG
jgi:sugar phosphate isomerase/epimerase